MLHYTPGVDTLSVILLVLLVLAAVFAGWLWASRAALHAALGGERGARAAAEKAVEAERALAKETQRRLDEAERALGEALGEARVLQERVTQMSERHRDELEAVLREAEQRAAAERRALQEAKQDFEERSRQRDEEFRRAIQAAAGEALKQSAEHLLKITASKVKDATDRAGADLDARRAAVEHLVKPIAETLKRTEEKLVEFDRGRAASAAELRQQAETLARVNESLRKETANLSQALRRPTVRGRYGEVQLRRVVELAGMRDYCDFTEQSTSTDDEGKQLRPDMIVHMPGGRTIIIDAKTNIEPYLEAAEASNAGDDARREEAMARFAAGVSAQVTALSKKSYWERAGGSASGPEFVVMFVPGDQFVDAALSSDPGLIERAAEKRVIIASPSTLIGLLRAVSLGWREERVAEKIEEMVTLGRELHKHGAVALEHAARMGTALNKAAECYNQFRASLDKHLTPTLRKFEQFDAKSSKDLPDSPAVVTVATAPSLPTHGTSG